MRNKILKINFYFVAFFFAMFFALPNFVEAGTTNINSCQNLNVAGETYVLQNDVVSDGTCFSIIGSNVTLDLNGHTVTYDNSPAITVPNNSFENVDMSDWELSAATNTTRTAGTYVQPVSVSDGSYALRIPTPTANQTIKTATTVNLEANTVYGVSLMYVNGVSSNINVSIGFEGVTMEGGSASYKPSQGFGHLSGRYKTGASPESRKIVITVTNAGSVAAGNVYIDDIQINKYKQPGIIVGPESYRLNAPYDTNAYYPNYTGTFGNAYGAIIKNGIVIQGVNKGDYSHSILIGGNSTLAQITNVQLATSGTAASNVWSSGAMNNAEISYCTLNMLTRVNPNRQAYLGANVKTNSQTVGLKFQHNTIQTGLQSALVTNSITGTATRNDISYNTISLQSNSSNDFAIVANGSDIHDNTIDCGTGNNSCRGIWGGGINNWATGTKVYNNVIDVQQLKRNQEYNGCEMMGAYGIQIEETTDAEVYGNTVTAHVSADGCEAHALRVNPNSEGSVIPTANLNNKVHNNTFIAVGNGNARASSMKLTGIAPGSVDIYNNTFRTNSRWIYVDDFPVTAGVAFANNKWETSGTLPSPFYPFEVYTYYNASLWASGVAPPGTHFNGNFVNNSYGAGDQTRFESEVFRSLVGWPNPDPSSSITILVSDSIAPSAPNGLDVQ